MSAVVQHKNLNFLVTITGTRHFYIHILSPHSVVPNTMYIVHIPILLQSPLYKHGLLALTNLTTITTN